MTGTTPHFHRTAADFSATFAIETMAAALTAIRDDRDLTDTQMGLRLGKSPDRAREYRLGLAGMTAATFLTALAEFGPAFGAGPVALAGFALVPLERGNERDALLAVSQLVPALVVALQDDNITDDELRAMAGLLETAGAALDGLRARLRKLGRA